MFVVHEACGWRDDSSSKSLLPAEVLLDVKEKRLLSKILEKFEDFCSRESRKFVLLSPVAVRCIWTPDSREGWVKLFEEIAPKKDGYLKALTSTTSIRFMSDTSDNH